MVRKLVDFVVAVDKKHEAWVDSLEDWKAAIYMFAVFVVLVILWQHRPF